jgi:hypothetical protein
MVSKRHITLLKFKVLSNICRHLYHYITQKERMIYLWTAVIIPLYPEIYFSSVYGTCSVRYDVIADLGV